MARINRLITVVRDGMHNAFTDMIYWHGMYVISYRKGTGHISNDGEAIIAVSSDRQRFKEVARVKINGDTRDPKLVPMNDGRLAMIAPSWIEGVAARKLQQFICFSSNAYDWSQPQPICKPDQWLWRVREHGGKYYGLQYGAMPGRTLLRDEPQREHQVMISSDLLKWEKLATVGPLEVALGESDITFHESGEAWIVVRKNKDDGNAMFASAMPPYTNWDVTPLNAKIHAPVILSHQGKHYVAGRARLSDMGMSIFSQPGNTTTGVWLLEKGKVTPVLNMPAAGDCSYCGLIEDPAGRVCISYYSQHAYAFGFENYAYRFHPGHGENVHHQPSGSHGEVVSKADVYFAELDLEASAE